MAAVATPPATPPAAPPSTPAAPPSSTPPASTPAAPAGEEGASPDAFDKFDTAFQDLGGDRPAAATSTPTPTREPKTPKATPAAPAPAKPAPGTPPQDFEEVEGIQVPRFKKDSEFRGWGLAGYKKAKQLETDLAQLRTQHQQIEQEHPKTKQERDALAARLAEIEKQYGETVEQVKYLRYERSSEYKEKYEIPYQKAAASAYEAVKQLTVTEPDPTQPPDANGVHPTRERAATEADFDQIYQLPLGAAAKLASKKFGPELVGTMMQHYHNIRTLAKDANNALAEWKTKAQEREKSETDQRTIQQGQIQEAWQTVNKRMSEDPRGADLWAEVKDDKEINEAIAKGFELADRRFSDQYLKLPPMEQIVLDASIRHRVAAFYRQRVEIQRLKAEHAQALKDLAEIRGSGPGGPGTPGGGEAPSTESEGPMAEFEKKM